MYERKRLIADLLVSISGVLIFLSVAHFIDLNGFSRFSPLLILAGAAIVLWINEISSLLAPLPLFTEQMVLTVAHVLIFLGLNTYLTAYVGQYWIVVFLFGVILLNTNKLLTDKLFG